MANKSGGIMGLMLSLIFFGTLFPIGLIYVYAMQFANVTVGTTSYVLGDVLDPTLIMLICTVLPLVLVFNAIRKYMKFH